MLLFRPEVLVNLIGKFFKLLSFTVFLKKYNFIFNGNVTTITVLDLERIDMQIG